MQIVMEAKASCSPCVHNSAAITLPGIIVTLVVHKGVLVGLIGYDVPVILVVQEIIVVIQE